MIKAKHRLWAKGIFYPFVYALLRQHFGRFYLVQPLSLPVDKSILLTPNHFSWWDGFFAHFLNRKKIGRKYHIMMLEKQLRRYWYFRHVGAYSVHPGYYKSVIDSLNYSTDLLGSHKNLCIIYPQGKIEPYEKNPLSFQRGGLSFIAERIGAGTVFLPVIFKIVYSNRKKPDICCLPGALMDGLAFSSHPEEYETDMLNLRKRLDIITQGDEDQWGERLF